MAGGFLFVSLLVLARSSDLKGPCDIYAEGNTPCVAAHSLTRALYGAYSGALYQVKRASDGATKDISVLPGAGIADSSLQDSFCEQDSCIVFRIYDQSPSKNHLALAPAGGAVKTPDKGVDAAANRIFALDQSTKRLRAVYGAKFEGGMGYRNDNTSNIAVGDEPESMYMVVAGKHYNGKCCFDYGNAEVDNLDHGPGTMEAIYFGSNTEGSHGAEDGPWVMADLEDGLWAGSTGAESPGNTPIHSDFVTAMVKGDTKNRFALKHADATAKGGNLPSEKTLKTLYDGKRPAKYEVMKKQGAIILGIGGDNSNWAVGTFYEGIMTKGFASDKTDDLVQRNILSAGYSMTASMDGVTEETFV
ncbi:abfB [Symbiodinium sp. CCMP2592]|nr:abfB [Symbiodinium sp. CCMP2592]